jgi:hypothetical protein
MENGNSYVTYLASYRNGYRRPPVQAPDLRMRLSKCDVGTDGTVSF